MPPHSEVPRPHRRPQFTQEVAEKQREFLAAKGRRERAEERLHEEQQRQLERDFRDSFDLAMVSTARKRPDPMKQLFEVERKFWREKPSESFLNGTLRRWACKELGAEATPFSSAAPGDVETSGGGPRAPRTRPLDEPIFLRFHSSTQHEHPVDEFQKIDVIPLDAARQCLEAFEREAKLSQQREQMAVDKERRGKMLKEPTSMWVNRILSIG